MEAYNRIEYKIKKKIEICKEEEVLVNGLDFKQKEKEEIEKNKEVLIITECGVPDYGTEEIKDKIMQAKEVDINTDNKTEVVDKTSNKFDKVEDISSSIWAQVSKSLQSTVSGFLNQGIQKAEVYAEASNNKEPKSTEESNFSRKKGKERFIILNRLQGNHIHKFVDQKYESKKKSNNMHYEGKENQN
ncbi:29829_t:CDS:2, partial [Gigaspora margarita]